MEATIEKIRLYRAKGEKGTDLSEGRLVENLGLEGDCHADGGKRQISLLLTETLDQLMARKEEGLCISRFKENITLNGLTSDILKAGVRLEAGEAVLEITGEIKRCFEECTLYHNGKTCTLAGSNLFARVVKTGVIRTGDRIRLFPEFKDVVQ